MGTMSTAIHVHSEDIWAALERSQIALVPVMLPLFKGRWRSPLDVKK